MIAPAKQRDNAADEWMREILVLPEQASTYAADIDHLHYFVIGVTMLGAVSVALVAAYFVIRFRRGRQPGGPDRPVPRFQMPVKLEVGLVTLLVVLFFGWWWIGIRQYMRVRVPPPDTTDVYVMGKQWMFKFSYPEGNSSVDTLYVPAGRPIRLLMTSRDVIHAFYVPEFRVKQDLVPGRYTTTWFEAPEPGVYDILCTEFCGTGHSDMRGQVVVLPPTEYEAWLEGTTEPTVLGLRRDRRRVREGEYARRFEADPREGLDLVDVGEIVAAEHGCLRCHTTDGSPHIGPSFAGLYRRTIPLADGTEVVADEAYLTESMMDPLAYLHAGFQPVMPSYKGRLEPAETAALVELIKSLREIERWMEPSDVPGAPPGPPPTGDEGRFAIPDVDADQPPLYPGRPYPPPQAEGTPVYPVPNPTSQAEQEPVP